MNKIVLLIILVAAFLLGCGSGIDPEIYETNIDMKIVQMNSNSVLSQDKFHKPELCTAILLETLKEPVRYVELNTCDWWDESSSIQRTLRKPEWVYNHKANDIIHFNFIRKDKFFDIKEEYKPQL